METFAPSNLKNQRSIPLVIFEKIFLNIFYKIETIFLYGESLWPSLLTIVIYDSRKLSS